MESNKEGRITFQEYLERAGIPFRVDPERGEGGNVIVSPVDCLPFLEDLIKEFPHCIGLFQPEEGPKPRLISG